PRPAPPPRGGRLPRGAGLGDRAQRPDGGGPGLGDHADAAHARALEILDATDKIAWPVLRGRYAYTLWRDADHPRGLWRRVPWTVLERGAPGADDPAWEDLVDVDALASREGVNWVYAGTVVRRPADDRALIRLSRGGAD